MASWMSKPAKPLNPPKPFPPKGFPPLLPPPLLLPGGPKPNARSSNLSALLLAWT